MVINLNELLEKDHLKIIKIREGIKYSYNDYSIVILQDGRYSLRGPLGGVDFIFDQENKKDTDLIFLNFQGDKFFHKLIQKIYFFESDLSPDTMHDGFQQKIDELKPYRQFLNTFRQQGVSLELVTEFCDKYDLDRSFILPFIANPYKVAYQAQELLHTNIHNPLYAEIRANGHEPDDKWLLHATISALFDIN